MLVKSTFLELKKLYKLSEFGGGEVILTKSKRTAVFLETFPNDEDEQFPVSIVDFPTMTA